MDKFIPFLLHAFPMLVIVLGLLLCGAAGFFCNSPSEAKQTAITGVLLIILGICGFVWPFFVFMYPVLMVVALIYFALTGLYHTFVVRK